MKKAITPAEMIALANVSPDNGNSTQEQAQMLRVLKYLLEHGAGVNRFEAESHLNVCHLAGRILSLKQVGFQFITTSERAQDSHGQWHDGIARYRLASEQNEVAA